MATEQTAIIVPPDTITIAMWQTFVDGRQAYLTRCEAQKTTANGLLADYYGSLAVWRRGWFPIQAPEALLTLLRAENQDDTNLAIVGFVTRGIGAVIQAATNDPLPTSLGGSSGITPTPSDTPPPAN